MTELNIIDELSKVIGHCEKFLATTKTMGPNPRQKLTDGVETLKDVKKQFIELSDFVPLVIESVSRESILADNLNFWLSIQDGKITDKELIQNVVKHSMTLGNLKKSAIQILSIDKFSDSERENARMLGDFFFQNRYSFNYVRGKFLKPNADKSWFKARDYNDVKKIIAWLLSRNIIDSPQYLSHNKDNYMPIEPNDLAQLSRAHPDHSIKINFNIKDKSFILFISGHWFNAYAYEIIFDHLNNLEKSFEIYSKVEYAAPPGLFKDKGDFDIIAMIGNTIILAECKSSTQFDEKEISKVIYKTEGIKTVFQDLLENCNYMFFYIYNPLSETPKETLELLKKSDIHPVSIDKLWTETSRLLKNL